MTGSFFIKLEFRNWSRDKYNHKEKTPIFKLVFSYYISLD